MIDVSGSLDATHINKLAPILNEILLTNPTQVIFKFGNLDFIDSAGLGQLLRFYMEIEKNGGRIHLVDVNEFITQLINKVKLDGHLKIYPNEMAAQAAFAKSKQKQL